MQRKIVLAGDIGKQRFRYLWTAFLSGADAPDAKRTFAVVRQDARVAAALEHISVSGRGPDERELVADATLALDQCDLSMLLGRVEHAQWKPHAASGAVDAFDWLAAADKIE